MSYLLNTLDRPFASSSFADMDHYLGFYAPTLVHWFWDHPWLDKIFHYIYLSLTFQGLFILFYLGAYGRIDNLQRYMMQYMIAGIITAIIGGLYPAVGTHEWYGFPATPGQLGDLECLYDLRHNIVDLRAFKGIVQFPSFHTTVGVLITYAFRDESKFIFIPIVILNMLMIFSCVSHGGHFLVDLIGGTAIAFIAIGIERVLLKRIQSSTTRKTNDLELAQTFNRDFH